MPTVQRDDLAFDVTVDGPGDGDPVLLLHGFPQRSSCWSEVAPLLAARGHRTIAPDQRGYSPGARPAGRAAYVLPQLVADAVAVIDGLAAEPGRRGRAHVVGHDWGAVVAWALAGRHPERVRTLTALSVPPPAAYLRSLVTSRQGLASWYTYAFQLPWAPERVLGDRARFVALLRRTGQTRAAAERDAALLAEPGALTAALNWYRAVPLAGLPAGRRAPVQVPSQFVWSDGDAVVLHAAGRTAHRHVTGPYRYVELRGVSHWIPDQAPAVLADLVLEHVAAHPRRPSSGTGGR
jgi:pimeloyl-ACP methyl ester carboxylesterase